MPAYLKGWALSRKLFSPVAKRVAKTLEWPLERERHISFPKEYDVWRSMRVDYAFDGASGKFPKIFLELETLDRSQLYNFHPRRKPNQDVSKLWHYYGILAKHLEGVQRAPRAFVFLLILPDERVGSYSVWDADRYHRLLDSSLVPLIRQSPFRIYDPLIKATARQFLAKRFEFPNGRGGWSKQTPKDLQGVCELVFLTATRTNLVVSRGKEDFSFEREAKHPLQWR